MEARIYLATTPNGFIARSDDSTAWCELEWRAFMEECQEAGNLIVGRRTFEVMSEAGEFKRLPKLDVVVLSSREIPAREGVTAVSSPAAALKLLGGRGFHTALVGGGRETAAGFLRERLAHEIVLDVEPILFAEGIQSVSGFLREIRLSLISYQARVDGGIQLRYKIIYEI